MELSFDADCRQTNGLDFRPRRLRDRSAREIVMAMANFQDPPLQERHKLLANFGSAVTGLRGVAGKIQMFQRRAYDIVPPIPAFPAVGLDDIADLSFEDAYRMLLTRYEAAVHSVASMFECNRVGRITWGEDDTVRFDYILASDEMGLLTWKRHRTKVHHELVKAVEHPLDEPGVPTDQRTRDLIAILQPDFGPYARIITGLQILQKQEHAGTDEHLTELGRVVNGTRQAAGSAARTLSRIDPRAAGVAVAGVGLAALGVAALKFLATAATAVAIADPCLAIGEYCLHGWE